MAKKNKESKGAPARSEDHPSALHPDTKKSIWGLAAVGLALIFILAGVGKAGPFGAWLFDILTVLLGWGYFILPVSLVITGLIIMSSRPRLMKTMSLGMLFLMLSVLGMIELASPGNGGWLGLVLGSLRIPFGIIAAFVIDAVVLVISVVAVANIPLMLRRAPKIPASDIELLIPDEPETLVAKSAKGTEEKNKKEQGREEEPVIAAHAPLAGKKKGGMAPKFANYVPPPMDLLKSSVEKPTTGDLRANANIIKRTLESFGIPVDMGEINIGPKVTRYTLKPAEGVKLSRITALNQDLSLALAAHPIRIEAPIPGKSLVGIEVPNKSAAVVRLGSLMAYSDFQAAGPLSFVLGRDVTGEPIFANIEKMPHLLIAGSTGSGKSVMIHALLMSLLYKNSPSTLRIILIDPKRVELTAYENLPHLVSSVVTEPKKSVGVFKWAISEMDRRYQLLQVAGSRDIKSYNTNGGKENPLPYIVIVVDELADLMTTYGREIEGSIVRLAQMARATGIHLILSTQRPSVEVITGLIKANITARIALQVASQVDSRTILDTAGAEKLLGGGDLLFVSSELSKPKRIQGAYVSEEEIHAVTDFIRDHNDIAAEDVIVTNADAEDARTPFDEYMGEGDDEGDALYDEAVQVVGQAGKASASLLQRRLKVGYARAARLLDLMEEHDIIGPGDGAKPREVYMEKIPQD